MCVGFKVYWQDGSQLVPPQYAEIIEVIGALNYDGIKFEANADLFQYIGAEKDAAFEQSTRGNASFITTLVAAKEYLKL